MKAIHKISEMLFRKIRLNATTRQEAILLHLRRYGSINQYDATSLYNVLTLPKTISGLISKGHVIVTQKMVSRDDIGEYSYTEYHYLGTEMKDIEIAEIEKMNNTDGTIN